MSLNAATFDPSERLDLYYRKNRDGSKKLTFTDSSGAAYDISALDLKVNIKYKSTDSANVLQLTTTSGLTIGGAGNNELTITLTDTQTNIKAVTYYWELYNDTSDKTWLNGDFIIYTGNGPDITDTTSLTINLDPDTISITISESGGGSVTSASIISALGYTPDNIIGVTLSGADTKTGTASPVPSAYVTNQKFLVYNPTVNTGAVTVNLNSLGAKALTKNGTTALSAGDMPPGFYLIAYDGTRFQIVGVLGTTNTASNGITLVGGDFRLGGPMSTGGLTTVNINDPDQLKLAYDDTGFDGAGYLLMGQGAAELRSFAQGSLTDYINISLQNGSVLITDNNPAPRGIQNSGDYSSTFVNESLITKRYADTKQPLDSDLTAIAALSPTNDDIIQRKSGAWTNRTMNQLRTDLQSRRMFYKNNVSNSVTGTTNETLIDSILIPAGTLGANDILNIMVTSTKSGTNSATTARLRVHTSAAIAGTVLATCAGTSSTLWNKFQREVIFKNSLTSQIAWSTTTSMPNEVTTNPTAHSSLSLDFTVDQYIIVSLQQAGTSDTSTVQSWYVEIIRNS